METSFLNKPLAYLVLSDGTLYEGFAFGYRGKKIGEVVFNTAMTGYQEVLTDPSYAEQIIVMTYPHIGNYGTSFVDMESEKPHVSGFVCREFSKNFSNFRATESLQDFMERNQIIGIEGIDTRQLVRKLRSSGVMQGIVLHSDHEISEIEKNELVQSLKKSDSCSDIAQFIGTKEIHYIDNNQKANNKRVVVMDLGIKQTILTRLLSVGIEPIVVPANTSLESILELKPDGFFLSNGPGDPASLSSIHELTKKIMTKLPVFGICLGHQLIGIAGGGNTFKMKFGHRGANHPVKNLLTNQIEITSQNHGYALDIDSISKNFIPTHINLNDGTLAGMMHKELPVFSVQYHPESAPGPHDSRYLFDRFVMEINNFQ